MRRLFALTAPAVLSITLLTACETTRETGTDLACTAFGPITFSASGDTSETIRQIREHNAAWDELCALSG